MFFIGMRFVRRKRKTFLEILIDAIAAFIQYIRVRTCEIAGHAWHEDKETINIWHIRCNRCGVEWDGTIKQYKILSKLLKSKHQS